MDGAWPTGVVAMNATNGSPDRTGRTAEPFAPSGFDVPEAGGVDGVWTSGVHVPRWVAGTGLIGLVLVVASGMFVYVARGMLFTPEAAVADFFTELSARHVGELPRSGIRTDLVTGANYVPPANPVVESVRRIDADHAFVTVGFDLAGEWRHIEVSAVRAQFWGPWTVAPPTGRVVITWPHDIEDLTATINGTALEPGHDLLPGLYTVGAGEHAAFESTGAVSLVVTGDGSDITVAPPIRPRLDLVPRLSALVNGYLDDCAAGADDEATFVPGCPLRLEVGLPWPENISWRIDAYPRLSLTIGASHPLEVDTIAPGRATATFEQDGDGESRSIEINAGGWIELEAGRMIWHRDNLAHIGE